MTLHFATSEAQRRAESMYRPYVVFHNAVMGDADSYMVMPEKDFDATHAHRPQFTVDAILNPRKVA